MGTTELGLIVPLPGLGDDVRRVRVLLDVGAVASVWVRDLPVTDVDDEDSGQGSDPWWYLGRLCEAGGNRGVTGTIGTASIILGLRHPLVVARAAAGAQLDAGGRFVLGIGSGGKPEMNDALGIGRRGLDAFAVEWRRLREAMRGLEREPEPGSGQVSLHVPPGYRPPPVQLASSDVRRWQAIDGDADGWQTFLTEDHVRFEKDYLRVCSTRGADETEVAIRLDAELVPTASAGAEPHFTRADRGRVRCSAQQLLPLIRPWLGDPVRHVLLRLHGYEPADALRRLAADWPR